MIREWEHIGGDESRRRTFQSRRSVRRLARLSTNSGGPCSRFFRALRRISGVHDPACDARRPSEGESLDFGDDGLGAAGGCILSHAGLVSTLVWPPRLARPNDQPTLSSMSLRSRFDHTILDRCRDHYTGGAMITKSPFLIPFRFNHPWRRIDQSGRRYACGSLAGQARPVWEREGSS